jgi:hypothetical protein
MRSTHMIKCLKCGEIFDEMGDTKLSETDEDRNFYLNQPILHPEALSGIGRPRVAMLALLASNSPPSYPTTAAFPGHRRHGDTLLLGYSSAKQQTKPLGYEWVQRLQTRGRRFLQGWPTRAIAQAGPISSQKYLLLPLQCRYARPPAPFVLRR